MRENTVGRLMALREELAGKYRGFPSGCCQSAHLAVEKQFGFEAVFGVFVDSQGNGHRHHWNESDEEIVDLTAGQFDDKLPDVHVVAKDSDGARRHYIPGVYCMY